MKRLSKFLAAFSIAELVGRHPVTAGVLTLLGVGGGAIVANLVTPTIVPQSSAYFNVNQTFGYTNNALKTDGGSAGAGYLPSTPTNSWFVYVEGQVDPQLGFNTSEEYIAGPGGLGKGLGVTEQGSGAPSFFAQYGYDGIGNTQWWNEIAGANTAALGFSTTAGSNYYPGLFQWTATGGGCAREPSGIWQGSGGSQVVDPGFLCATTPTVSTASIAGTGAQQTVSAVTCASNSPVSGEMTVTATVPVAHGTYPGQTYTLQGFTPSGYNATYTALAGTTGATLVGETTAGGGTCPASVSVYGTALSGTGAAIAFPGISTTAPFTSSVQPMGITTHNAQHFCGIVGEYGADSNFPGAQFAAFVDDKGDALPNSPVLVPWLNQGIVTFTGYTTSGTQSPSSPALTVTSMPSTAISNATYSGSTGYVTFTTSASAGLIVGSEFTVSGVSPSGYNQTYVAVAGTSGARIVGSPLSGPVGTPQALSNPGAYSSGGSMVSVIMPGMIVLGSYGPQEISPYGTFGGTGTGGGGTYGLTGNQSTSPTFVVSGVTTGGVMTVTTAPTSISLVVGTGVSGTGIPSGAVITALGTGTGGTGTYTITPAPGTAITTSTTLTDSGTIGTSSAPVNIFAWPQFYYSAAASTNAAGGVTTARSQGALSEFINTIGSASTTANSSSNHLGWGGSLANLGMYYGVFPQATGGAPSTSALASLCTKTADFQAFATSNTLTVHSLYRLNDPGIWADSSAAQFTGSISGTALTIASTQTGSTSALAAGTVIAGAGITGCPSTCPTIASGSGTSYTLNTSGGTVASEPMTAGAYKPAAPVISSSFNGYISGNTLTVTSLSASAGYAQITAAMSAGGGTNALTGVSTVTGTLASGMLLTDGGASITGTPLVINGGSGATWTVNANYYPAISSETMYATSNRIALGSYVLNSSIVTPVKIVGYGTLNNCATTGFPGCGTYTLSTSANGSIGSSGSPVAFNLTSISDGGAADPGPALTIQDMGPGVTFPVTNYGAGTGTLNLSGTYSASALGGNPSAIQAQVSYTAGGPAVSGCSACAWTTLTNGVVSDGAWSGQALNIPAGGPYYVSVRAANGTAYATMPNLVKVGLTFNIWGDGQAGAFLTQYAGEAAAYTGLWGYNGWVSGLGSSMVWAPGPDVLDNFAPAQTAMTAGDPFGATVGSSTALTEGLASWIQPLENQFGWPVTVSNAIRDGIGIWPETLGNAAQTQTIGLGNGSATTWCSQTIFCSNVGLGGKLLFNAASLTGATFTGSISGTTLSISAASIGALMPGMVLSGAGITGSPILVNCTAGCSGINMSSSTTWTISINEGTVGSEAMTAAPTGGAPWSFYNIQSVGLPLITSYGSMLVQAGTFTVTVNGTVVCQDSQTFAWNIQGGNCTGAGISSAWVNYATGDYAIDFSSPPASGAVISASWRSLVSADEAHNEQLDFFGNGSPTSGPVSSMFAKSPGGVSAHYHTDCINDANVLRGNGYPLNAIGVTQEVNWLYGTRWPALIPGASAATPVMVVGDMRGEGPVYFTNATEMSETSLCDAWGLDVTQKSTFSGTIASGVLTLTAAAVGPMWEGEIIGCNPYSLNCAVTPGTYITSLASGTWGAIGSTYNLSGSPANVSSATAMQNEVYYGAVGGTGAAYFLGPVNDQVDDAPSAFNDTTGYSPHPGAGAYGPRRIGSRFAALTWGALSGTPSNASDPTLDRTKADAGSSACDSSALAAPCFDIGTTYQASATATWTGSTATVPGGLAAHARPFAVGMAVGCSGCNSNLVITSVSAPPTQSTTAGAGQVGTTFTFTTNGTIGGSGSGAITGGCAGTAGTGSNCIDLAFTINTGGTYGTAAALATCGVNNLNGTAALYAYPNGNCVTGGIGDLVRNFRTGTAQSMNTGVTGSVYDDGLDPYGGGFNQSSAFTCNIVAATVVQCVKGAKYVNGVYSSIGEWASGATFVEYGDPVNGTGRNNSLFGSPGGQPFAFTPGSGYTNGTYTLTMTGCTIASGGTTPKVDVTVSDGEIVDVYGSSAAGAMAYGVGAGCSVTLTGMGSGTGGAVTAPTVQPNEGVYGIGTFNSDSNLMGTQLYDNSGLPGNPLNSFFTNGQGGYFEPGLPVRTFGEFMGVAVSG